MAKTGRIIMICLVTLLNQTVCEFQRYFSFDEISWRNCTDCLDLYRETKVACNLTSDTICGDCFAGDEDNFYFGLSLDNYDPCMLLPGLAKFSDVKALASVLGYIALFLLFVAVLYAVVARCKAKWYKKGYTLLNTLPDTLPDTSGDDLLDTLSEVGCRIHDNNQHQSTPSDTADMFIDQNERSSPLSNAQVVPTNEHYSFQAITKKKQFMETWPVFSSIDSRSEADSDSVVGCNTGSASFTDDNNSLAHENDLKLLKTSDLRREAQDPKSRLAYPQLCKHIVDVCEQAEVSRENGWLPIDFRKVVYKSDDRSFGACIVSKEEGAQINVGLVSLYIPPDAIPTDDLYLVYLYVQGGPEQGYHFRYGPHGLKLNRAAVISFPTDGYSIFRETDTSLYEQDKWEESNLFYVINGGMKNIALEHFSGGQNASEQEMQAAFRSRNRISLTAAIFGPKSLQRHGNNIQVCLVPSEKFKVFRDKLEKEHVVCLLHTDYHGKFDMELIIIKMDIPTIQPPQEQKTVTERCFDNGGRFHNCKAYFTFTNHDADVVEFFVTIEHEKDKPKIELGKVSLSADSDESPHERYSTLEKKPPTLEKTTIEKLCELLSTDDRYIELRGDMEWGQLTPGATTKETIEKMLIVLYGGDVFKLFEKFKALRYDDCTKAIEEDRNFSRYCIEEGKSSESGKSIGTPTDDSRNVLEGTTDQNQPE